MIEDFEGIEDVSKESEYIEGYAASRKGISPWACPYDNDFKKAMLWMAGWHNQRIDEVRGAWAKEMEMREQILDVVEKFRE